MQKGFSVTIIGITVLVLGIIFHMQGHSIVGPQSSFMYSSPEWVTYGIQIAIIGTIVLIAGGILIKFTK